jgi:hypothetical protein
MPKAVVSMFLNVLQENVKLGMGVMSDAFLIKAMQNQLATFGSMRRVAGMRMQLQPLTIHAVLILPERCLQSQSFKMVLLQPSLST